MTQSPTSIGFELKEKVASLQAALLSAHPLLPTLLSQIRRTLKQYPEQVILLESEEINIIVQGLEKQTGIELVQQTIKSSKSNSVNQKIKSLGSDAF